MNIISCPDNTKEKDCTDSQFMCKWDNNKCVQDCKKITNGTYCKVFNDQCSWNATTLKCDVKNNYVNYDEFVSSAPVLESSLVISNTIDYHLGSSKEDIIPKILNQTN